MVMRLSHVKRLGLIASLLLAASSASAADYALSPDGNFVTRVTPITRITSSGLDVGLLTAEYPGWAFTKGGISGTTSQGIYDAGWLGGSGGAKLTATYSQSSAPPTGSSLNWIQIIDTNAPMNGTANPYIDPRPNDDNLPFYLKTSEQVSLSAGGSVRFSDFSRRGPNDAGVGNDVNWNAKLYAAEYDGNQSAKVGDGFSWGWSIKSATLGSSSGIFNSPSPTCPPATCSGTGTSSINWGLGNQSSLSFVGSGIAPKVGDLFSLGTLTYRNGATQAGSEISRINLNISLSFTNIQEENFVFLSTLGINNTPNTDDPIASADFISFINGGFSETFNVEEGKTASVTLMGKLNSVLDLTPASPADKDLTGSPDPTRFKFALQLVGLANPSAGGFVGNVPEPATWLSLVVGFGLIGATLRQRKGWCSLRHVEAAAA